MLHWQRLTVDNLINEDAADCADLKAQIFARLVNVGDYRLILEPELMDQDRSVIV